MKFIRIKMNNFMRYKGENEIVFSRDPEKNVTVVLGDNTAGKTTLAQAFRWGLYGRVTNTQYDDVKNVSLLNNDVLAAMDANSSWKEVRVEIEIENTDSSGTIYEYRIIRKAMFARKFPQLVAVQKHDSLEVYVTDKSTGQTEPISQNDVKDIINQLLPEDLSPYFLFDGEKWNDTKSNSSDIKESIENLLGISAIRVMKEHLGSGGQYSVINQLKKKISGTGSEYSNNEKNISDTYQMIENTKKKISDYKANGDCFSKKAAEIEGILNANPNVEKDQAECKRLEHDIERNSKNMKEYYADIVTYFSKSYKYFAAPLLQKIVEILKDVELEGVDIPGVTDKTIMYLLENRRCLCGHEILPGSSEEAELLRLINVVPPAEIGAIVLRFQEKIASWNDNSYELLETITDKADSYQMLYFENIDNDDDLYRLQKKVDRKVNFANERKKLNKYRKDAAQNYAKAEGLQSNIEYYKKQLANYEQKKEELALKDQKNAKIREQIAYAEELYNDASKIYESKKVPILSELNTIIEKNFREMFNEQEKMARIDENYNVKLLYRYFPKVKGNMSREATGLSEGEKIARNFAFIVSVLELVNNKKADGEDEAQQLPLILDAPFSKLSDINTAKIAQVLPPVAEQVIIFMLDKDWKPSGLAAYTDKDYIYRTVKDVNENSSKVCKSEEI